MSKVIFKGLSVDEAIQNGLNELNVTKDMVTIQIIEEGKKGFLGFGKKEAIVSLRIRNITKSDIVVDDTLINVQNTNDKIDDSLATIENEMDENDSVETVENVETEEVVELENSVIEKKAKFASVATYLENITKTYGAFDATVSVIESSKKVNFQIETTKAGLLIGKHGKIINALQILAQTLVYREDDKTPTVVVNIGDYRQRREEKLKEIADRTAKRVLKTNQAVFLEALPAYERKIIHARLSKFENITTHSEGKEPHRYLVVDIKK